MKPRSVKYHIKQGAKNVTKNGLMSVASIISVTICSLVLIMSLIIAINLDETLKKLEETIGISLYLGESVSDEEIAELLDDIQEIPNIRLVEYMSKANALEWAKSEWGDNDILSGFEEDNPFPRSFEIYINGAQNQKQIIAHLQKIQTKFEHKIVSSLQKEKEKIQNIIDNPLDTSTENTTETNTETTVENITENIIPEINIGDVGYEYLGINKISHSQQETEILLTINNAIRVSSIIIIMVLAVVAVTIIVNTIKLTVFVRKTEINIMKYVGATDWFIRWPFIIEGMIIGISGSVIAIISSIFIYQNIINIVNENFISIKNFIELKDTLSLFIAVSPGTIILGMLLGVVGAVHSIKRYLNA